ncbi:MAG: PQQ-binding-like beta-propeller repeat protein [Limnochordales bacterium]|nr:PQQ-binding-like beta-propeller repeat protein [Limnochordales bacterium]
MRKVTTAGRFWSAVLVSSLVLALVAVSALMQGWPGGGGHPVCAAESGLQLPFAEAEGYFLVLADLHIGSGTGDSNTRKIVQDVLEIGLQPDFILLLGDITEMNRASEWRNAVTILRPLEDKFPVHAVPGNHDARWASLGERLALDAFGPTRFALDWRGIRMIGINTSVELEQHGHVGPAQRSWLAQQLASAPGPVIVGGHHPIGWDSDFVDDQEETMAVFSRANVPLVLSGHGHSFVTKPVDGRINQMIGAAMDGWYAVVARFDDRLVVYRRKAGTALGPGGFEEVMPIGLGGPSRPDCELQGPVEEDGLLRFRVKVGEGEIIPDWLEYRVDQGSWDSDAELQGGEWVFTVDPERLLPGVHRLEVRVSAGMREYRLTSTFTTQNRRGRILWQLPTGDSINLQPFVDGEYVFVGNAAGRFLAANRRTGEIVWEFQTGGAIYSSPTSDGEKVYFGANDGFLYALDRRTGKQVWRYDAGAPIYGDPVVDAENGTVLVASGDGRFHAVRIADGAGVWKASIGGTAEGAALLVGDEVWVTSWVGAIYRFERRTGQLRQRITNGRTYFTPGPCTPALEPGSGVVAVTNTESKVYGFDKETGKQRWVVARASGYASAAVDEANRRFVLSTLQGEVYALDAASGAIAWSTQVGSPIYNSSPVLWRNAAGETEVLVGTTSGQVWRLAVDNGRVLGVFQLGDNFLFGRVRPADGENVIYAGSMDGTLYALAVVPASD